MQTSSEIRKSIHDIANALHNAYETLDNVEVSLDDDREFCVKAIQAAKEERQRAFACIAHLRAYLKEQGAYE